MKWTLSFLLPGMLWAATTINIPSTYLLPLNCAELLPDGSVFVGFMGTAARGLVGTDQKTSRSIFRILALRDKLNDARTLGGGQNPVDVLVRKTLCFYREQKEPLRAIPYDDPNFLKYLRGAVPQLEEHVKEAVYQYELEKAQKRAYELRVQQHQRTIEILQNQAEREAQLTVKKLSKAAKSKVKAP